MQKLGNILLAKGWATRSQIERAESNQKTLGGNLDTCLLEMSIVSEEQILTALSQACRVPSVDVETLREVPEDVLGLLPEAVARRCSAVPFESMGTKIRVAMQDPNDLSCQDEISFASGKRVEIHVSSEVRMAEALERYYGKERSSRLSTLAEQLNRARYLWRESKRSSAAGGGGHSVEARSSSWEAPSLPGLDAPTPTESKPSAPKRGPAADGGDVQQLPVARPKRVAPPSSVQLTDEESQRIFRGPSREAPDDERSMEELAETFDEAQRQLQGAKERDTVGRSLLQVARRVFDRSALLAVKRDAVEGWMADAQADADRFDRLRLPADQPSVFFNVAQGIPFHLGPLPDSPIHRALAEVWDGSLPQGAFVLPIRLRDRLVAVLYGDRRDAPPGRVPTDRFQALAEHAATALERCIMLKKKGMA